MFFSFVWLVIPWDRFVEISLSDHVLPVNTLRRERVSLRFSHFLHSKAPAFVWQV
jgi:hypothetical protein